ncbi:hypothetical protein [Streptomyces sp. NPDC002671]
MVQRDLGVRELARLAQASHPTVKAVLDGTRLPASHTVLLLELALDLPLYPSGLFEQLRPTSGNCPGSCSFPPPGFMDLG